LDKLGGLQLVSPSLSRNSIPLRASRFLFRINDADQFGEMLLVESESPERENAEAGHLESTEEIGTGNSLIESETQQHKRNTERKRPEESPQG
jgi:hypothetical protein